MNPEDLILKISYCLLIAISGGIIASAEDISNVIGWILVLSFSVSQILKIK